MQASLRFLQRSQEKMFFNRLPLTFSDSLARARAEMCLKMQRPYAQFVKKSFVFQLSQSLNSSHINDRLLLSKLQLSRGITQKIASECAFHLISSKRLRDFSWNVSTAFIVISCAKHSVRHHYTNKHYSEHRLT